MKRGGASDGSALHSAKLDLARNSAWNLVALFATICMHFVTVPIVIARIGLSEFGGAGLVLAVWAPLLLIGTVMGQAVTRELGNRALLSDTAGARRILEAAALVWLQSTVAGIFLLVAIGPSLLRILTGVSVGAGNWRWEFVIAGIAWAAQYGSLILQGASVAHQNFRAVAWVALFSAAASVVAIVLCTTAVPDASGYLAGLAIGFLVSFALWLAVTRVSGGAASFKPRLHRAELQSLFAFGKWQGVAQFAGTIGNQVDRYALGALASAAVIGQYNAAKRMQEAVYSVAWKVAEVLFPFFTATAQSDLTTQARLYLFASWVVMSCGALVLGPMIPLADPIMRIWVGAQVASGGAHLLRTLVLGGLVGCASNVFTYYLMGVGKNVPAALVSLIYSLLTIVLSILFLRHWGPVVAGMGLAVAGLVRLVLSFVILKVRIFIFIPVGNVIASTVVPLTVGAVLAYGWCEAPAIENIDGWGGVALAYAGISLSIAASICIAALLTSFGRSALGSVIRLFRQALCGVIR